MTSTAAKNKERQFIVECIKFYRGLPCLWNTKSKQYYDRERKKKAYYLLLCKYKEMYPEATRVDVKKKLNVLRTNYRKELKKYLRALEAGESYKPKLWYFHEMDFLHDENSQEEECEYSILDTESFRMDEDDINESATKIMKTEEEEPVAQLKLEYERVEEKDEFYYWAMACASDLRKMERTQQLYAKKAFADILLEGQLGLLHRHSVNINENTQTNCSQSFSSDS